MVAARGGFARMSFRRQRVWALVILAHLLLAWWLVTVTDQKAGPVPRPVRDAVLIQQVVVAPAQTQALARVDSGPAPASVRAVAEPVAPPRQTEPVPAPKLPPATPLAAAAPKRVPKLPAPVPAPAVTQTPMPSAQVPATAPPSPLPAAPTAAAGALAAAQVPTAAGSAASPGAVPSTATAGASIRAPSAAAPASAPSARAPAEPDVAAACPGQVEPETPKMAIRGGVTGEVVAQALIVGGKVTEVRILSGPPVFHNAVREAMLQYRCVSGASEARVTQHFTFRLK